MMDKLAALTAEKQTLIATLMWNWCCERNTRREEGKERQCEELVWIIKHQASEFCNLQVALKREASMPVKRWTPPAEEWVKINVDGSYRAVELTGGWGAVLRDHVGEVVSCAAGFLPNIQNALHAEVLAPEAGLRLASELGILKVVLETDALLLKEALEEEGINFSSLGVVIDRLKAFICSQFMEYKIEHCPRLCNQVAHALAAKGTLMAGVPDCVSDGCDPCVALLVASDLASRTV